MSASAHIIGCNADPFLPEGWRGVVEHHRSGELVWSEDAVVLHVPDIQLKESVTGDFLFEFLQFKPLLNANVLDYLLAHPEIIPEGWKQNYTFFWGTIYRDNQDKTCVRFLRWDVNRWGHFYRWFTTHWNYREPAALRAG